MTETPSTDLVAESASGLAPCVPPDRPLWRTCVGWALRAVGGVLALVLTGLFVWAWRDRSMPELETWHRSEPASEFRAEMADGDFDFADYMALEDRVFTELADWMIPVAVESEYLQHSRFRSGGPHDPAGFGRNWNRSVELVPDEVRGGALLIHGLSDSPYSFRSLAELLHARGYYVLCLRLPGHGTVPAGLLDVTYEDWHAAVDIGARHVAERIGEDQPFVVAGFSCGGALATQLVVDSVDDDTLRVPDHTFLFSPAIGITAFARASNWHKAFSWLPLFEKSKWLDIEPEYDPYKYNSFTKNAGAQMWRLTQAVQADLQRVADRGETDRLPPILAFQSAVDATIVARDIADHLFARLPENGSEFVLFDVNEWIFLKGLYSEDPRAAIEHLETNASEMYRFTAVTNRGQTEGRVVARSTAPHSSGPTTTAIGLAWPADVYSLSHVALPLPPDDPFYGYRPSDAGPPGHFQIGMLALRGENDVIRVSPGQMLRLRSNPFHEFMMQRISTALAGLR